MKISVWLRLVLAVLGAIGISSTPAFAAFYEYTNGFETPSLGGQNTYLEITDLPYNDQNGFAFAFFQRSETVDPLGKLFVSNITDTGISPNMAAYPSVTYGQQYAIASLGTMVGIAPKIAPATKGSEIVYYYSSNANMRVDVPQSGHNMNLCLANTAENVNFFNDLSNMGATYWVRINVYGTLRDSSEVWTDGVILASCDGDGNSFVLREWSDDLLRSTLVAANEELGNTTIADIEYLTISMGARGTYKDGSNIDFSNISSFAIDVRTIPEPGTYAMLAGLSIVGFAMIRRRRERNVQSA